MLWILPGFLQDTSSSASRTWTRQGCLHPSSSRCRCSELCQNCMISVRAIRLGWWTVWLWAHGLQTLVKPGSGPWRASVLTAVQSCHLEGWTWCPHHSSFPSQWLCCFLLNENKCYPQPMDDAAHGNQQYLFVQGLRGWRSLTAQHTVPKNSPSGSAMWSLQGDARKKMIPPQGANRQPGWSLWCKAHCKVLSVSECKVRHSLFVPMALSAASQEPCGMPLVRFVGKGLLPHLQDLHFEDFCVVLMWCTYSLFWLTSWKFSSRRIRLGTTGQNLEEIC